MALCVEEYMAGVVTISYQTRILLGTLSMMIYCRYVPLSHSTVLSSYTGSSACT